ncbi:pyrimidine/purine nucleoside phosphorylase [Wenyingzhuangia sp. 2_MG-2023]|uniref:pyrimidine/purine nucleoside phosphorylase n=1 Tax=Wenyingzhuangia sp. 2_MG-2023 TaxID=3062639 RepID=UPI0026E30468|nr:pyrimidine/purine nucleoside phosphorylase [Wenyingzhuangia sp. 2_MG-2023]MDO6738070.1 pyrimidine/purine nucleoside phosphorylase [Wenyingzhuangia sp. 2_MG-2023]MDO6802576.1 pyrimidine/purine nucleoside phosphorylase [Wenyingzhuangia sp. 1_MG-2023]
MISANEYFDGNVKSLGYESATGKSTLGVMEAGEYEFATSLHETMNVVEGEMTVKLPGSTEWVTYKAGEAYQIEANEKFQVKVSGQTSYLCQYK